MIPESDLELGQFRLLDVDQKVIIPVDTHIRLIVTAADVLHDYAVPSLGVKLDAVPGLKAALISLNAGTSKLYKYF
jgi:cytochrome c oxidase subunit 2